ncbi:hypothetical protein FBU30_003666 [Linnemannia zychae]|nr:hypothetical protein FBU30_003666 [Linnemannia zychae]
MDPISQLPLECLQCILQILYDDGCESSLAALLRMNKYLASVTLPYLYRDPFRHSFTFSSRNGSRSYSSGRLIACMLLQCLSPASLPTGLSLALSARHPPAVCHFNEDESRTDDHAWQASFYDYFAHIRHLNLEPGFVELAYSSLGSVPLSSKVLAYFASEEFINICRSWFALSLSPSEYETFFNIPDIAYYCFSSILQHEVPWCLAFPIFEQLESLTIHNAFSIKEYRSVINRLSSLEKVRFLLLDILSGVFIDIRNGWYTRTRKEEAMVRETIEFVREHAQLFPGRLRRVFIFEDRESWVDYDFTSSVLLSILSILPPLSKLTKLGKDDWQQLFVHKDTTDLSQVWRIDGREMPNLWYDTVCAGLPILQQCRALKVLKFELLRGSAEPFVWAVKEKLELEKLENHTIAHRTYHGYIGQEESIHYTNGLRFRTNGLIPLENVYITNFDSSQIEGINNIANAFSRTLKQLTIHYLENQLGLNLTRALHIGQGWTVLPVLTYLTLNVNKERLVISRSLFAQCPNLKAVDITDWTNHYQCCDIIPCLPAHLDKLQSLKLTGWSALTFHSATLLSTTHLTNLELSLRQMSLNPSTYKGFVPPLGQLYKSYGIQSDHSGDISYLEKETEETDVEEEHLEVVTHQQITRPRWTWDWDLPCLTRLVLETEFAYLFEFKMLNKCPKLEYLRLEIRSCTSSTTSRTLTYSDFIVSSPKASDQTTNQDSLLDSPFPISFRSSLHGAKDQLYHPSLQKLDLFGQWIISAPFLQKMFTVIFPNLVAFSLQEWDFVTFKSLSHLVQIKAIFPKEGNDRRRRLDMFTTQHNNIHLYRDSNIHQYSRYDDNHDDDAKSVKLYMSVSTPSRQALSRLGWKIIGQTQSHSDNGQYNRSSITNEKLVDPVDLGVSIRYLVSNCFSISIWLDEVCNGDFGLFD